MSVFWPSNSTPHKHNQLCNEQLFHVNVLWCNSASDAYRASLCLIKISGSPTLSYFVAALKQVQMELWLKRNLQSNFVRCWQKDWMPPSLDCVTIVDLITYRFIFEWSDATSCILFPYSGYIEFSFDRQWNKAVASRRVYQEVSLLCCRPRAIHFNFTQ